MTSLAINKSTVFESILIHPSPLFEIFKCSTDCIFRFSIFSHSDVVSQRKVGFKTNAASMRAIASAIGGILRL